MTISKRKLFIALASLLSAFGTTAVQASDTGWYVGANAGLSNYGPLIDDSENGITGANINNSNTATGWSILGGYQFKDWLGLEFSYFDMGSASANINFGALIANYKLTGESADVVFNTSTQGWGVFGKAGITAAHVDEPISGSGFAGDATDNSTILDLGAGVSYGMQNGWGFRLGFTQYHNPGNNNTSNATGQGNVNFLYLGAICRF